MKKPVVLFVCSHNAFRSQMAEGWLRHLAGDRVDARSAGVDPGQLSPLAVQVMREVGVDIAGHRAKGVRELLGRVLVSHLVVVCDAAQQSCPRVWPGVQERLMWPFDDPSRGSTDEERLAIARRVRDEIHAKIEAWLPALDAVHAGR